MDRTKCGYYYWSGQSKDTILRGVKERKSPGPDNLGGRCAEPLSDILAFIFNKSLQSHRVPNLCKESVIVPVPKTKGPKSLNDFRPVALTSPIMKAFEKNIKQEVFTITQPQLDPLPEGRLRIAVCSTQFLISWKGQCNLCHYQLLIFHQLLTVFNHTF